jgi:hypothetical protein
LKRYTLVRPVLGRPGRVPVLVKGIVLSVESGVICRRPDIPCDFTRACYDSGPAEA